jgi:hypothetical protein
MRWFAGFKRRGPGRIRWVSCRADSYPEAVRKLRYAVTQGYGSDDTGGLLLYAGPFEDTEMRSNPDGRNHIWYGQRHFPACTEDESVRIVDFGTKDGHFTHEGTERHLVNCPKCLSIVARIDDEIAKDRELKRKIEEGQRQLEALRPKFAPRPRQFERSADDWMTETAVQRPIRGRLCAVLKIGNELSVTHGDENFTTTRDKLARWIRDQERDRTHDESGRPDGEAAWRARWAARPRNMLGVTENEVNETYQDQKAVLALVDEWLAWLSPPVAPAPAKYCAQCKRRAEPGATECHVCGESYPISNPDTFECPHCHAGNRLRRTTCWRCGGWLRLGSASPLPGMTLRNSDEGRRKLERAVSTGDDLALVSLAREKLRSGLLPLSSVEFEALLMAWLKAKGEDFGVRFWQPEAWRTRGEEFGNESGLVMTSEGGWNRVLDGMGEGREAQELYEEWGDLVSSAGWEWGNQNGWAFTFNVKCEFKTGFAEGNTVVCHRCYREGVIGPGGRVPDGWACGFTRNTLHCRKCVEEQRRLAAEIRAKALSWRPGEKR